MQYVKEMVQKMWDVSLNEQGDTVLTLTLPAGGQDNVNPELLCDAYFATADSYMAGVLDYIVANNSDYPEYCKGGKMSNNRVRFNMIGN